MVSAAEYAAARSAKNLSALNTTKSIRLSGCQGSEMCSAGLTGGHLAATINCNSHGFAVRVLVYQFMIGILCSQEMISDYETGGRN